MRKEDAAKFLGVSVRTLELYTQQGRIGGHYEKGKTRPVLMYDEEELRRFKAELENQSYPHRPTVESANETSHGTNNGPSQGDGSTALALPQETLANSPANMERLLSALVAVGMRNQHETPRPEVPIEHKLFLTLDEAQAFTGLSRGILREAIRAGELPAKIIGRGWRIRRADLEAYAQGISMTDEAA